MFIDDPAYRSDGVSTHRRDLLKLFALGIVGTALPAPAASQTMRTLRVGKAINSSFTFAGLELGQQQGIWKAQGLDIQISAFRGDGQMQQAFAAGSIDFGFGSGPGMGYAVKGVPARAVAAIASKPANMALVVGANSKVARVADLKGKRSGVTTAGSLTDWLARKIAAANNWKPGDLMIVPMGEMRTRLAAMRGGDIAGAVTSVQEAYEIQNKGLGTVLMTFAEVVPNFITNVIFARDALITGEPDVVRRFLRGWFSVAAFMRSNRAATVKSIAATMRLSEKVIDETYALETGVLSVDGRFDPAALDVIRTSLKDLGILTYVPAAAGLYSGNFVPVKVG
jgi:ABC-type nitrate/sulfonate/bicarbonate transport system substrate-binding protein